MQTNCHMSVLVHEQAKKYGDREMLIYQDFGGKEWKSLSWNQVSATVKQVSNALLNLAVHLRRTSEFSRRTQYSILSATSVHGVFVLLRYRSMPPRRNSRFSS